MNECCEFSTNQPNKCKEWCFKDLQAINDIQVYFENTSFVKETQDI